VTLYFGEPLVSVYYLRIYRMYH